MKLNTDFLRGREVQNKKRSVGEVWIFSGTVQPIIIGYNCLMYNPIIIGHNYPIIIQSNNYWIKLGTQYTIYSTYNPIIIGYNYSIHNPIIIGHNFLIYNPTIIGCNYWIYNPKTIGYSYSMHKYKFCL